MLAALAAEVNEAKAALKAVCVPLQRVRRRVAERGGGTRSLPLIRVILRTLGSEGILTTRGGITSHAAVVARGWGIPAVVGAGELVIDDDGVHIGDRVIAPGTEISIDGRTGEVFLGAASTSTIEAPGELTTLLDWADRIREVRPERRLTAKLYGGEVTADGTGRLKYEDREVAVLQQHSAHHRTDFQQRIGAVAIAEGDLPGGRRLARGKIEQGAFSSHAALLTHAGCKFQLTPSMA